MRNPDLLSRVHIWISVPFRAALAALMALTLAATMTMAQEDAAASDTAKTPPTMAEVEQAWKKGDFVFVREGLEYLAETEGTPLAQYRYGRVLLEGRGGPRDTEAAAAWLQLAAEQNHVEAMTLLARVYLSAKSSDQDEPEALRYDPPLAADLFSRAAALGNAEAQYYLGLLYRSGTGFEAPDPEASFTWMLAAAKQEHVEAMYELSRAYSAGLGTEADPDAMLTWLTKAAENGHLKGQFFLAQALETGNGAPKQPSRAVKWYLRAAENGLTVAQRDLGTHYLRGDILEQNTEEGLRWLQAAAAAGDSGAMSNLGAAYASGMGVDRNDKVAVEWYARASQHGLGRAMTALAAMLEAGRGTEADMDQAIGLYLQALQTPDAKAAQIRLGQLAASGVLDGQISPHNAVPWARAAAQAGDDAAMTWLNAQADAGVRPAMSAVAALYLEVEDTREKGAELLQKAAMSGDPAAQVQLGKMHMTGDLVELDYVAAHKWFNIAAAFGQSEAADLRETANALMTPEQVADAQAAARNWFENEQPQPPSTDQSVVVTE